LHQRPEYNELIEEREPELSRFPSKIWPEGCDIQLLQKELIPLFSTDFKRLHWLLEMSDGTLIELAYDCGKIIAEQAESDICEIELELVKGDAKQLFILAQDIAALPNIRLGNASKAQRGYMLMDNATFLTKPISFSKLNADMSISQALSANFQHGLTHLQYHENCYIESHDFNALVEFQKGIMFLHQNIHLFKEAGVSFLTCKWVDDLHWLARSFSWINDRLGFHKLLENNAYYIRKLPKLKQLTKSLSLAEQALPDDETIFNLLHSRRYCQLILGITEWLLQLEKSTQINEKASSLVPFSQAALSDCWSTLTVSLSTEATLDLEKLLPHQGVLVANLMTGLSFGHRFNSTICAEYRYPWLDIYQGLLELSMLDRIYELALDEKEIEVQSEYLKWVKRKQASLLSAIEQSKQRALTNDVYWLNVVD